jgi:hypothetical protein
MPDILFWLVFPFRREKRNGKMRRIWFERLPAWLQRDAGWGEKPYRELERFPNDHHPLL